MTLHRMHCGIDEPFATMVVYFFSHFVDSHYFQMISMKTVTFTIRLLIRLKQIASLFLSTCGFPYSRSRNQHFPSVADMPHKLFKINHIYSTFCCLMNHLQRDMCFTRQRFFFSLSLCCLFYFRHATIIAYALLLYG